jgi:hypothetical protein
MKTSDIEKYKTKIYLSDNKELVARCKKTGIYIKDPNNLSGKLTSYILDMYGDVTIPSNTYQRKKYEIEYGKKWFEEYFDIIELEKKETRKCKLCNWETIDIDNKTGCFEQHIINTHNINIKNYIDQFPEDKIYHKTFNSKKERDDLFLEKNNYVICKLCNEKMKVVSNTHLKNKHNITPNEYKLLFPDIKLVSESSVNIFIKNAKIGNINIKPTWTSKGEIEVKEFIESLGFDVDKYKNRKLLDGKEIDLVIEDYKLCIEYNGLYYHTEKMGKTPNYHLDKTIECNKLGYRLIHIFEDEWLTNKELVKNKIRHILKVNSGIKIGGRNIMLKSISSDDKSKFLKENHIQGNDKSSIYYGAYYKDELVGIMTFNDKRNMTSNIEGEYELSRFATKQNYIINGLASKILKKFISDYSPKSIISFADRRWTLDINDNLYTKLGFKLVKITKPNYSYYNSKVDRYKRFHKFGFGKNNLKKKYIDLDYSKSEKELTTELGFSRIWDCGLFKYSITF